MNIGRSRQKYNPKLLKKIVSKFFDYHKNYTEQKNKAKKNLIQYHTLNKLSTHATAHHHTFTVIHVVNGWISGCYGTHKSIFHENWAVASILHLVLKAQKLTKKRRYIFHVKHKNNLSSALQFILEHYCICIYTCKHTFHT